MQKERQEQAEKEKEDKKETDEDGESQAKSERVASKSSEDDKEASSGKPTVTGEVASDQERHKIEAEDMEVEEMTEGVDKDGEPFIIIFFVHLFLEVK